jgi:FkbM family methyltransferase
VKAAAEEWPTARPIDALARFVERASSIRPLRRLRSWRPVNRLVDALYHAQLVDESLRFAARELLGRRRDAVYRPRGRRVLAKIRHRTGDLYVLNEIVRHGSYRPPPEAAERLAALGRPPRVLDVGANIGLFGIEVFDRFPEATVTAFEPDPANADVLEDVLRINGLDDRWKLIRKCAGTSDGVVSFAAGRHVGSRIESAPGAVPMPIVDLFPYLQEIDFVKMDIEGSEWPILSDPRLAALRNVVVVVEYHSYACPYPHPGVAVTQLFARAGFTSHEIESPGQPEETGIAWAWK